MISIPKRGPGERLKDAGVRKPKELAVLMEVASLARTGSAKAATCPRSRACSRTNAVGDIATHAPTSLERLASLRLAARKGFDRSKWGRRYRRRRTARHCPRIRRACRRSKKNRAAIPMALRSSSCLKVLLRMTSERHAVASKVDCHRRRSRTDCERRSGRRRRPCTAWRRELFGEAALSLKHGRPGRWRSKKGRRGPGRSGLGLEQRNAHYRPSS